ncbi:MAG TPA: hypothetical protein VD866_10235 [Urbifossiella sp.]|nr:hypothetical protein [Urbifossiella sp.]
MSGTKADYVPLRKGAKRIGESYESLRRLARAGVFTRGRFSVATKRPPVYLRTDELDAWRRGGLDEVRRVQNANARHVGSAGV